jgi:ankyrin repeat protein
MGTQQSISKKFESLDNLPFSIFQIACFRLDNKSAAILLKDNPSLSDKEDTEKNGITPLIMCSAGYKKRMNESDRLRSEVVRTDTRDAFGNAYRTMMRLLLRHGADINHATLFGSLARWAISCRDIPTLKFLVDNGVDLKCKGIDQKSLVYIMASMKGGEDDSEMEISTIDYLLEAGVDINSNKESGRGALHAAVRLGKLRLVKFLLSKGASPTSTDNQEMTILHYAISRKTLKKEMLSILIQGGARVDAVDDTGMTSLHYAVVRKGDSTEMASVLLEGGACVNATENGEENENGASILFLAVLAGCKKETVQFLVSKGADVQQRGPKKMNILHAAVFKNASVEVVDYILDLGLDPLDKSDKGENAFDIAGGRIQNFERLFKLKEEHQAKAMQS